MFAHRVTHSAQFTHNRIGLANPRRVLIMRDDQVVSICCAGQPPYAHSYEVALPHVARPSSPRAAAAAEQILHSPPLNPVWEGLKHGVSSAMFSTAITGAVSLAFTMSFFNPWTLGIGLGYGLIRGFWQGTSLRHARRQDEALKQVVFLQRHLAQTGPDELFIHGMRRLQLSAEELGGAAEAAFTNVLSQMDYFPPVQLR